LFINLNASSGVPIYRQIVDQIKVAIATGWLRAGDQIPSVRALSEALKINPTTVQRAFLDLDREHVIEMRRGQGAFVRRSRPMLTDSERERRVTDLLRPAVVEAQRVHLEEPRLRELFEQEVNGLRGQDGSSGEPAKEK